MRPRLSPALAGGAGRRGVIRAPRKTGGHHRGHRHRHRHSVESSRAEGDVRKHAVIPDELAGIGYTCAETGQEVECRAGSDCLRLCVFVV